MLRLTWLIIPDLHKTQTTSRTIIKAALHFQTKKAFLLVGVLLITASTAAGCASQVPAGGEVSVQIIDGNTKVSIDVPLGSSVAVVLDKAGVRLNPQDRSDPPTASAITAPATIRITRVVEEYEVEEKVIPFERQTVRNESLPEGETLLIQSGENGLQRVTYRRVLENGVQTSRSVFEVKNVREARPEIVMIGVQAPFTPVDIPGRLVYLLAGNAWMMENSTANRRPVLSTGDLDGRVFSLSPDGEWLLCSRSAVVDDGGINSLWAVNLSTRDSEPINLQAGNVIHYAGWDPGGELAVYFSSVEPRSTAPGWQANNDLVRLTFSANGSVESRETILAANAGGVYGWWGMNYIWSPDGQLLAYARPDSIGLVDFENHQIKPLIDIIPYQTGGDWAWVPGLSWSGDSRLLYVVTHTQQTGLSNQEESPYFALSTYLPENGPLIELVPQVGMFAYPVSSPFEEGIPGTIAYLQAIFPEQSGGSRYRLAIMDQDGSNSRILFPPEGGSGIEPQQVVWNPPGGSTGGARIAFIHQGNIWLIDPESGKLQQVTGDGLITRLDWQ